MAFDGLIHLIIADQAENGRQQREVRILQKELRDASNPFTLPNAIFLKLFRLDKQCAQGLIDTLSPLMEQSQRLTRIPIHLRIFTALHFFGQGSYQLDIGHGYSTTESQPTVSRCIAEVTDCITNHLLNEWIKFPNNAEEWDAKKRDFNQIGNEFSHVVGVIDCTHIRIIAPAANHPVHPGGVYYCRKKFYAINTQIICDANRIIVNINARFPGSVHDFAIWTSSGVRRILRQSYVQNGLVDCLLGDRGYPLEPWLLVPFNNPAEGTPESRFNTALSHIRIIIEHTNGMLKGRFRCLHGHRALHYNPIRAAKIIYSCAVLHNMCRKYNVPLPDNDAPLQPVRPIIQGNNRLNDHDWFHQGVQKRYNILQTHFM